MTDEPNIDDEFDFDEEPAEPAPSVAFTSPVMSRSAGQRLSVEMLQQEIPKIRAGEAAQKRIDEGDVPDKDMPALRRAIRDGARAKEVLFEAALPLIRTVSLREFRRRQQWNSRVPLDDLMQEATIGFFKGLAGFKVEAIRKSATNYLGQWMLVEMRRAAEVMDHDLQVGHDAGERFRRIRALRSRLIQDLGREPSDEEIAEASRDPKYVTRPGMVGKAPEDGEKASVGKGLTAAQVAEERASRDRVGQVLRMASSSENSDEGGVGAGFVDAERVVFESGNATLGVDPADILAEEDGSRVIAALVGQTLAEMDLPSIQVEIIARRYGLPPYSEESSAREIARVMNIHRERVSRVLTAFTEEMTVKGGMFHKVLSRYDSEDMLSVGLGWIVDALGSWDSALPVRALPSALTETITVSPSAVSRATGVTEAEGLLAWYQCDYEDKVFSGLYPDSASVPKSRKCPDCQRPSALFKVARGDEG